jgi:hypothetical protein
VPLGEFPGGRKKRLQREGLVQERERLAQFRSTLARLKEQLARLAA